MRADRRKGASTAVVISAVVVVAVILLAAYEVATVSARTSTTTSTTTVVTTVTSDITSDTTVVSTSDTTVTSPTTVTTTSVALAPLISYSADAYSTETTALLAGFSKSTGTPVAPVISGGSNADASSIKAGAPDDVFLSVSLAATSPALLGNLSSNWAIGVATDQMVLAYSNATAANSEATSIISQGQTAAGSNATSDWNAFFTSLSSGSVKVGISSPISDPAGLRGWLVLEIAGYLYSAGNQQAYAGSMVSSNSNVTASSAANLVAPLQSGQIQFLFIYKSAAINDGLKYLTLDPHLNLSNAGLASFYSRFSYTDSAGKASGSPIVIVITVPLSSQNMVEALEFVQYVVKNMASLSSYGLVIPPHGLLYSSVTEPQALPSAVQLMLSQGLIVQAGPI